MAKEVYGVDLSHVRWVPKAAKIFLGVDSTESICCGKLATSEQQAALRQFILDNPGEYQSEEEAIPDFVDTYENKTFLWSGLEGLIVDAINERIGDEGRYRAEYRCIYVAPYIRYSDDDLPPSQKSIAQTLAKYLNPLLEEPVTVGWMYVYD